jgi:hypothetical protein
MAARKRRSPGEGGCWAYQTKAGERFRVKGMVRQPDGTVKEVNKRGFTTKRDGLAWLADAQSAGRKGEYVEPSRQRLGAYGAEVIDGLRVGPQTKASYRKNWRLHVEAYPIGQLSLAQLTGQRLTTHYRHLEQAGRKDHREGEGLSARTVRYLHVIIHRVLGQAVRDGLLVRNPADAATPPTAKEAKAPEMHPWDAGQLAAFLGWAESNAQNYALWHTLAMTGMRRGELLALRWRDVDLDAAMSASAARRAWSGSPGKAPRSSRAAPRAASRASSTLTTTPRPCCVPGSASAARWPCSWSRRAHSCSATLRASTAILSTSRGSSPATSSAAARCPGYGCTI